MDTTAGQQRSPVPTLSSKNSDDHQDKNTCDQTISVSVKISTPDRNAQQLTSESAAATTKNALPQEETRNGRGNQSPAKRKAESNSPSQLATDSTAAAVEQAASTVNNISKSAASVPKLIYNIDDSGRRRSERAAQRRADAVSQMEDDEQLLSPQRVRVHAHDRVKRPSSSPSASKKSGSISDDNLVPSKRYASTLKLAAKTRLVDVVSSCSVVARSPSANISANGPVGFLLDTDFSDGRAMLNACAARGNRVVCQLFSSQVMQLASPVPQAADCVFSDNEAQVISACDLLFLAIDSPEIFDAVVFGADSGSSKTSNRELSVLLASLDERKTVVAMCGALDSQIVESLARRVEARGARFIELQVFDSGLRSCIDTPCLDTAKQSSGKEQASASSLVSALKMSVAAVSGDERLCRQFTDAYGGLFRHCVYVGHKYGSAQQLRCSMHAMQVGFVAALGESIGLLERSGVNPLNFVGVLQNSALDSTFLVSKTYSMLNGVYDGATYSVSNAMHDVAAFTRLTDQVSVCSGTANAAHEQLKRTNASGHATEDVAAFFATIK